MNQKKKPTTHNTRSESDKEHGFRTIMAHLYRDVNKVDHLMSRVVHHPVVERVSDFIGATVARPSGLIGATLCGIVGLLLIYLTAKNIGFSLSGSEMPLLLIIGFLFGLGVEWCVKSLTLLRSK